MISVEITSDNPDDIEIIIDGKKTTMTELVLNFAPRQARQVVRILSNELAKADTQE